MARWYYEQNGKRNGPVADAQLKQLAVSGQLQPTNLIWREGMEQWQPARSLKGLDWPQQGKATQEDMPPPLPPNASKAAVATVALPGTLPMTGTIESVRQYLGSLKTLRYSFPASLFNPSMSFTNEAGQPVLWIAKDGPMSLGMTLWRDSTRTTPLLRIVKQKSNLARWDVKSISDETIGSLSQTFFRGWHIHLADGRVVAPDNRASLPKLVVKIAAFVMTAGLALLALMLLNPKPLWSLLSAGNSFSFRSDGQEICTVKKLGAPFDVYYQVDDLSAAASRIDPAMLVAALGMESTNALMTM